jgi:hypothetical protein
LAFAITFFAAAQWITSCVNNSSTSKQVDHMITAADRMDDAADSFSTNSGEISRGVRDAVDKLNLQAGSLSDSAAQASRLADNTETANQNVIEADRPWIGGYITVTDFSLGKKPNVTIVFVNSRKRPARLDLTAMKEEMREVFPKNPDADYIFDTVQSTSVIVPGQTAVLHQILGEVIQSDLDMLNGGKFTFFIFAKAEYRDLRTNQRHWTHICIRYIPKLTSDTNSGFGNCEKYNDAE